MANAKQEKQLAAEAAVALIEDGMVVGLGTGSTAALAVDLVGERVRKGLQLRCIPTSEATRAQAAALGIQLVELHEVDGIDLTIDGADEFDPYLQLIKGGGGALLREKIVATHTERNIVISDSSKQVDRLGAFLLPIEVIPFAEGVVWKKVKALGLSGSRREKDGSVFITDEQNHIFDLDISHCNNIAELNQQLLSIPGVVETGFFLNTTHMVIMGHGEETIVFK